ncbi:sigma factor-like helix-turn-helix DNA-binding protein [Streptomyces sp. NPDC087317]|uniref:sigma factor-like helix-turn-helix DNA-binding protein n=1 Tax=Streptomyces sp. NPDC087317 TaxID=3365784 RepID=UPI003825EB10
MTAPSAPPDEPEPSSRRSASRPAPPPLRTRQAPPAGPARFPASPGKGRPGRPLGQITADCTSTHRAWLEPVREAYLKSGLTMSQLGSRLHISKSKISELMSGRMYPRWEILYPLAVELSIPYSPLYRLWANAALETHNKSSAWVKDSAARVTVTTQPTAPPLDYKGFRDLTQDGYREYASVFLPYEGCDTALGYAYDQLWLSWPNALASPDARRYAWGVVRGTVMSRTPHVDGRPEFLHVAFNTEALQKITDEDAAMEQLHETLALLKAMSRLPHPQFDVIVLHRLCGMPIETVSDLMGAPLATVRSNERHATRFLDIALTPEPDSEGNHP